jgi:hypothetical protein
MPRSRLLGPPMPGRRRRRRDMPRLTQAAPAHEHRLRLRAHGGQIESVSRPLRGSSGRATNPPVRAFAFAMLLVGRHGIVAQPFVMLFVTVFDLTCADTTP